MKKKENNVLGDFFIGIVLFLLIQLVFMLGGLFIENSNSSLITGIPSAVGLTLVLILGLYFNSLGRDYRFMGLFVLAFLSPLIVFLIFLFAPDLVESNLTKFSMIYMTLVVIIADTFIALKIWRNSR